MVEPAFAILVVALVFGGVMLWREGLTLFAPKRSGKLVSSVEEFCENRCKLTDGRCPLTGAIERPTFCPLWKFVDDDQPTMVYGSPFEHESHKAA